MTSDVNHVISVVNKRSGRGGVEMAIQVKMFMTWFVLIFVFNSCHYFVSGNENEEANQKIIDEVLKHLNEENNTKYRYDSARIIETHKDVSVA